MIKVAGSMDTFNPSHIVMVGLGYIGLPTAALFAQSGMKVTGVDINPAVCETLNQGKIHIVEPGLAEVVKRQVAEGNLFAQTVPKAADVFIIAVPTPFHEDLSPDLTYVESAAKSIAPFLKHGDLVILESTSPIGTTDQLSGWLKGWRTDLRIATPGETQPETGSVSVAYCPERVLPGNVLHELVHNDRLIGGVDTLSTVRASAFYRRVVNGACVATNARTAEMAKLVENSYRDVNIAFANELSMLSERFGVDVWELIALANRHPRVNILNPGCGVGGHCIAVDPWFIVNGAPDLARIIKTARLVNDSKPDWVVAQLEKRVAEHLMANPGTCLNDLTIALYGLSFKPDIDDLRESPALAIATEVGARFKGSKVIVVEPHVAKVPACLLQEGVKLVSQDDAVKADVKVVLVAHSEFKKDSSLRHSDVLNVAWSNAT